MELVELQQQVSRELSGGERLLWFGRPRQGLILRPTDSSLIPFSLLWAGFAFFWEGSVVKSHAPLFFKLWGIPFVLVGIYMVIGRFFIDARIRKATAYAVSNQRVIVVANFPIRVVRSIPLRSVPEISLSEAADGSGTITFGSWPGARRAFAPLLEGIPQVRSVYETIREAQKNAA